MLPEVEGCNGVQIYSDTQNEGVFTLVENWNSEEVHKAHIANVVDSGDWETIAAHLLKDPESSYFQTF